jgi:hypothetical protein
MVVMRQVFQATFGQGGTLAAAMAAELARMMPGMATPRTWRVLTDLSGPFDTVVLEIEAESLAAHEQGRAEMFASEAFRESIGRTAHLMASGRNEFFTIEAQG